MIYRLLVEWQLRRAFAALNRGDPGPVLAAFAAPVEQVFFGSHALGGARHAMASIAPWTQRLRTVLADLRFDTQSLARTLADLHRQGVAEAALPPIESRAARAA